MEDWAAILYSLVALMYLSGVVWYAVHFVREQTAITIWNYVARATTIALHIAFLASLGAVYRQWPLVSYNFFTISALALAVVHTVLEVRLKNRSTGMFVFGLAFLLHLASYPSVALRPEPNELLQNSFFGVHVIAAMLGYVGLLVSAIYGVFHLVMYRMLKGHRFGLFFRRMPALDLLAKMNLHAAAFGFLCLTGAIVLGIGMSSSLEIDFIGDVKFLQSVLAWLMYAVLLGGRYLFGWRGRLQVSLSVGCFCLVALSSVAVRFLPTFHTFQ